MSLTRRPPRTYAPEFEALLATVEPAVAWRIRTSIKKTLFDCTTCKNGHAVTPETIRVSPPGRNRGVLTCCRLCLLENRRRARKLRQTRGRISRARLERVFDALHEGKTLNQIFGRRGNKYIGGMIVNPSLLYKFRKLHPKFDRLIGTLAAQNLLKARAVSHRAIAAPVVLRDDGRSIFDAISVATAHLTPVIRDDVRSAMLLACAEGRLRPGEIDRRVHEFVTAHYRMFSNYGPDSLDRQIFADGPMTLGDTITQGLWN